MRYADCEFSKVAGTQKEENRRTLHSEKTTANYSTLHGQCMCRTESASCCRDRKKADSLTLHGR